MFVLLFFVFSCVLGVVLVLWSFALVLWLYIVLVFVVCCSCCDSCSLLSLFLMTLFFSCCSCFCSYFVFSLLLLFLSCFLLLLFLFLLRPSFFVCSCPCPCLMSLLFLDACRVQRGRGVMFCARACVFVYSVPHIANRGQRQKDLAVSLAVGVGKKSLVFIRMSGPHR